MVLTSALLLAPLWKKHPQPMKPAHTRTKPLKGPSARNAQMPPRTAILNERASTCVMAYLLPCDVLCGGAVLRMPRIDAVPSLQPKYNTIPVSRTGDTVNRCPIVTLGVGGAGRRFTLVSADMDSPKT